MIKPITPQVDADVADAFNQTPSSQKQAIQSIVSLWLKHIVQPDSLDAITLAIRHEAANAGLTADILADLLKDD